MADIKIRTAVALACSAALLAGHADAQPSTKFVLQPITALRQCGNVDSPANGGVYKIVLPRRLTLSGTDRRVYSKEGQYTPPANDNGDDDDDRTHDRNVKSEPNPFHIRYKSIDFSTRPAYIMVRVIIQAKSDYSFWDPTPTTVRAIHGIAVPPAPPITSPPTIDPREGVLCGSVAITKPNPNSKRQIATFFIDRAKMDAVYPNVKDFPFNIIVYDPDAPETPIIIDPKIYNDG